MQRGFRSRARALAMLAGLGTIVLVAPRTRGETLAIFDFESDPIAAGWASTTPLSAVGNDWTAEESYSPTHSIRAADGIWASPFFPVAPFEHYAASFRGKTDGTGGFFGPGSDPNGVYLAGSAWRQYLYLFRGEPGETETRLLFGPAAGTLVHVDDVQVEPVTPIQAAGVADSIFAEMPPFRFEADPRRHRFLRRTIRKLATGRPVKAVLLGDSIVNDTSHSYFEVLVDREYPRSRLDVVTSVRGSTGCWWYRESDPETGVPRVETYVTRFAPDLVMIGGISHGDLGLDDEIDSIRDVIRQIRAADPSIEIVLMSEAAGANDPYLRPELALDVDPRGDDWRAKLFRLAGEQRVEYVDLTVAWARYILASGLPYAYFLRDPIHMNEFGSQVVGRALEAYFSPVPGVREWRSEARRPLADGR